MEDPEILTPSYHGESCRHSGTLPEFECCCDECGYYLDCFPDWKEEYECEMNGTPEPGTAMPE